jgi:hypothetical protein
MKDEKNDEEDQQEILILNTGMNNPIDCKRPLSSPQLTINVNEEKE